MIVGAIPFLAYDLYSHSDSFEGVLCRLRVTVMTCRRSGGHVARTQARSQFMGSTRSRDP